MAVTVRITVPVIIAVIVAVIISTCGINIQDFPQNAFRSRNS
jgi:hypothetical protein